MKCLPVRLLAWVTAWVGATVVAKQAARVARAASWVVAVATLWMVMRARGASARTAVVIVVAAWAAPTAAAWAAPTAAAA